MGWWDMTYPCGEKPGKGEYICTNCRRGLYLDEDTDILPPCVHCTGCDFKKVLKIRNLTMEDF